jgi:hypothetical protein
MTRRRFLQHAAYLQSPRPEKTIQEGNPEVLLGHTHLKFQLKHSIGSDPWVKKWKEVKLVHRLPQSLASLPHLVLPVVTPKLSLPPCRIAPVPLKVGMEAIMLLENHLLAVVWENWIRWLERLLVEELTPDLLDLVVLVLRFQPVVLLQQE